MEDGTCDSTACSTGKLSGFCENALAHSMLACWRNQILGSWPVLPDSSCLSMSGWPWLLLATEHQCEAMLKAGQNTVTFNALYSQALSSKPAATITLVRAYDGNLGIVSRTAGQIMLLLRAEGSAEQAPVLETDFCPQLYRYPQISPGDPQPSKPSAQVACQEGAAPREPTR